jgi:anhydro-N-acetylmuramic acid kinase
MVLGMMSGTSLDGLDIALCRFNRNDSNWTFEILEADTLEYPELWMKSLINANRLKREELMVLDDEYGSFLGKQAKKFIARNKLKPELIASHGHTIFHEPNKGVTFQLGNGRMIADLTDLPVVWDFRSLDMSKGGQGAPLVPVGDKFLFHDYEFCLNLGGFSNISFDEKGKRIAFDICPVNTVLNFLAGEKGLPFDEDGKIAETGTINAQLLSELNHLDYYRMPPPKSLGREWVEENIIPIIENYRIPPEDKLKTFCEHISDQLAKSVNQYPKGQILFTGGGTLNRYLMEVIRNKVTHNIFIPEKEIIQFKEALVFGFLGVLRMDNSINCFSSVTGASSDSSVGKISYPRA